MPFLLYSLPLLFPFLTQSGTLSDHGEDSPNTRSSPSSYGEAPRAAVSYKPRRRVCFKWQSSQANTSHIPALPCVGEGPVLPFQLFREGSRGHRNPHDGHKDGEAESGQSREIHRLCPHTAWEDRPGRHRQPSSAVRNPSERGEIIEIRGTEERRG